MGIVMAMTSKPEWLRFDTYVIIDGQVYPTDYPEQRADAEIALRISQTESASIFAGMPPTSIRTPLKIHRGSVYK